MRALGPRLDARQRGVPGLHQDGDSLPESNHGETDARRIEVATSMEDRKPADSDNPDGESRPSRASLGRRWLHGMHAHRMRARGWRGPDRRAVRQRAGGDLGSMLAITGVGLWLARGRHWSVAGYVPIAVVFSIGADGSTAGSIGSYTVLFYALAVLLAGALKPVPVTWGVLFASVALHLWLTSAGQTADTVLAVGITVGGCLAGTLLVQILFARELRQALRHAESTAGSLAAEVEVRRKAEAALAAREQELRSIVDQNSDGIAVTDAEGWVVDWNPAMATLTGVPKDVAVGKPLHTTLGPRTREPNDRTGTTWPDTFRSIVAGRLPDTTASHRDVRVTCKRGSERIVDLLMFRVDGPGGAFGVLSARDVTAERHLEPERQKSSQLESLGILAGGLAHDLNNLLTAIRGNLSLARSAAVEGPRRTRAARTGRHRLRPHRGPREPVADLRQGRSADARNRARVRLRPRSDRSRLRRSNGRYQCGPSLKTRPPSAPIGRNSARPSNT